MSCSPSSPSILCIPSLGVLQLEGGGPRSSCTAGDPVLTGSSLLPGHFPSQLLRREGSQRPVSRGRHGFYLRHRWAPCYQLGRCLPLEDSRPLLLPVQPLPAVGLVRAPRLRGGHGPGSIGSQPKEAWVLSAACLYLGAHVGTWEEKHPQLGDALLGPLPWGHLHLTAGLQSVCERPTVPLVLLPRPLSKQLQPLRLSHLLHLGYCPVWPGPLLPMEPPRSLSGALPEGPPVLLLVFQRQPEAALTSWLAVALPSPLELAPSLLLSPGCLM